MKHLCPVCRRLVTLDTKQFVRIGRRVVKTHKDGAGLDCLMSGKLFTLVERNQDQLENSWVAG